MKRAIFLLLAVGLFVGIVGCQSGTAGRFRTALFGSCRDCPDNCQSVDGCDDCVAGDPGRDPGRDPGCRRGPRVDPIPPSGVVTYPYYTTHGPRDFLARNPRSIGP